MIAYIALQLALCAFVLASFFRGTSNFLWAMAFLVPMNGLSMFAGVSLNWPKAIAFLLLVYSLALGRIPRIQHMPGGHKTLLLALYAALLSLWASFVDMDAREAMNAAKRIGWGEGQTTLRYLVQYFSFAQTWLAPFLVMNMVHDSPTVESVHRGFIAGTVTSASAGIYQVFALPLGLPWFSSDLGGLVQGQLGLREHIQMFTVGGTSLARLYGLSGEPKHTAALIVLALTLILASNVSQRGPRFWRGSPIILGFALALTFSTSGWTSAILVTIYFLLYAMSRGEWRLARSICAVLVLLGSITFLSSPKEVDAIFEERVSSRLNSTDSALSYEYKDAALLEHLQDAPIRMLFGHGPGGVDFFLIPYVPASALSPDSTITPTYTVARILSDVGLVGLLVAALIVVDWQRRLRFDETRVGYLYLGAGAFGLLFMPYLALQAYFFTTAAFLGYARNVAARERSVNYSGARA